MPQFNIGKILIGDRGLRRGWFVSVLVVAAVLVMAQEIDEKIPLGEGRIMILLNKGLNQRTGYLPRLITFHLSASDGTKLSLTLTENHNLTLPYNDDNFVNWTLKLVRRLRILLNDQGYQIDRRAVYRRSTDDDIIAVDAISIKPPAGVSLLSIDFDIQMPPSAAYEAVTYALYVGYQSYVTPHPDYAATQQWEKY